MAKYPILVVLRNSNLLAGPYIQLLNQPEFPILIQKSTPELVSLASSRGVTEIATKSRLQLIEAILS